MWNFFKLKGFYFILAVCLCVIFAGCSMPGQVFLSINFEFDTDYPDASFTCTAPNIPADIADIKIGAYYNTDPGTYTVTYSYSTAPLVYETLEFTLEQNITIFGNENAYYDLLILRKGPACYEVPQ